MPLPDFSPPVDTEMRALWHRCADPDVRRVILEVQHLRAVLLDVEQFRAAIDTVWKKDVGGQLVALQRLRYLLQNERMRYGMLSTVHPEAGVAEEKESQHVRTLRASARPDGLPDATEDRPRSVAYRLRPGPALEYRSQHAPIGRLRRRQRHIRGVGLPARLGSLQRLAADNQRHHREMVGRRLESPVESRQGDRARRFLVRMGARCGRQTTLLHSPYPHGAAVFRRPGQCGARRGAA